jgi:hypothetical protein
MTSRRYSCLAAVVVALVLGGLAWIFLPGLGTARPYFVLAAAAGGACLGWKVGREVMRKRWAELRVVARVRKELGLKYERKVSERRMRRYFSLPLLDAQGWRRFRHVMSGPAGKGSVLLFDCDLVSDRKYLSRTVVLFPDVGLPEFELHPRRFWEFLSKRVRVRFYPEELPDDRGQRIIRAFMAWYTVEALEEGEVRRLFSTEKVSFFIWHPGWEVQSYGGHLLLCKDRKKVPLQQRPALFREALALAGLFHPPLCPEDPWAGRATPTPWRIRQKPARFKDRARPGPGPASDDRFVGFE